MSEQCPDILRCDPQNLRQAMSIHTRKITDACRDKDCVEALRVYLTAGSQQTLDNAANVRVRSAQLLHTYICLLYTSCIALPPENGRYSPGCAP